MRDGRKISKKPVSILLFLCVLVLIPANIVRPQEKPLPAAIEVMAPCVMKSADAYTGFEIELWEEISKDLGLEFAYYETSMDRIFTDLIEPVKSLFSPLVMKAMAYLGLFIIVCGHVFWWVKRGHKYINTKYFPGIFQAYWYVMVTMTTVGYGDIVPRKWVGSY